MKQPAYNPRILLWFILKREIKSYIEDLYMSVGVMKENKLKLRDLHSLDTLGCAGDWNT
jgi:hypothetical protein